jgi:hypothetical protein
MLARNVAGWCHDCEGFIRPADCAWGVPDYYDGPRAATTEHLLTPCCGTTWCFNVWSYAGPCRCGAAEHVDGITPETCPECNRPALQAVIERCAAAGHWHHIGECENPGHWPPAANAGETAPVSSGAP